MMNLARRLWNERINKTIDYSGQELEPGMIVKIKDEDRFYLIGDVVSGGTDIMNDGCGCCCTIYLISEQIEAFVRL